MFIRKKLITDISAVQIRNVTEILKENEIAYEVLSKPLSGYTRRMADLQQGLHYGHGPASLVNAVTTVYVKPKDYERAKQLLP